ncbi:MAG: hypothetical protein ABSE73_25320 [Planctomycetota bacterium]
MKRHFAKLLAAAAIVAAVLILAVGSARSDFVASGPGAVLSVSTNGNVVYLPAQKGGSLYNTAPVTVYVGWDVLSVNANQTPGDNKNFFAPGTTIRIPARVKKFVLCTAGDGAGVVQYLEP